MRGSSISVSVKSTQRTAGTERLICQWPDRVATMKWVVPFLCCQYIAHYIRSKLPKGSKYRSYRMGLEVARIRTGGNEGAYTVDIDLKSRFVKQFNVRQELLYVHARPGANAKVDPKVKILEEFNPWTFESLPFTPDRFKSRGTVISKRARREKVASVTKARLRDRRKWAPLLAKHGWREVHKDRRIQLPKKAVKIPNLAQEALKLEFGLDGSKSKPLWRLSINRLIRQGMKQFIRDKKFFVFPLTNPSAKLWKHWPPKTKHIIPKSQAIKYMGFEKKLGIRPRK